MCMGKSKNEMKKIHRKKIRKAKEKLKLFNAKKIPYQKISRRTKKILMKERRATKKNLGPILPQ